MRAFVLSGGGAKGSFEVGVLKNLYDKGIIPDKIFGTSTGALNAAGYSFLGIDGLLAIWNNIKGNIDIMKLKPWWKLPFDLIFGSGLGVYSMAPLENIINSKICGLPNIDATVCRVSLRTSKKNYVSVGPSYPLANIGDFKRAVLASASTPIMNDIVDGEWVDGGVRQITPLQPAIDAGADDITVILGEPLSPLVGFTGEIGNVSDVFNRTIACMVQEMFWQDINNFKGNNPNLKLTVYAPSLSLIGSDEFDPTKIKLSIQQGLNANPVLTI